MKKILLGLLVLVSVASFGQNQRIRDKIDTLIRQKVYDPTRAYNVFNMLNVANATITASGTNTYTAPLTGLINLGYLSSITVTFTNANTSAATLNIGGTGAKPIVKDNGAALVAGDLPLGCTRVLIYNGTSYIISSPTGSGSSGITQLTGDVTAGPGSGSVAATVAKINGNTIPANALGFLKNNGSGTLSWSAAGTGTVTTVSGFNANGLTIAIGNPTTTPAITLGTSITGMLKGNGSAISAGTSGVDYVTPAGTETLSGKTLTSPHLNTSSTAGYVWTATDGLGAGSWQLPTGGSFLRNGNAITSADTVVNLGGPQTADIVISNSTNKIFDYTADDGAGSPSSVHFDFKPTYGGDGPELLLYTIDNSGVNSQLSMFFFNHDLIFQAGGTATDERFWLKGFEHYQTDYGSDATGDMTYRNSSGYTVRNPIGSTGQVLKVAGGLPTWGTDLGITALTGDVTASGTGSVSSTVTRLNGVTLSSLATGILKNTTGTGAPSIIVAGTDIKNINGASILGAGNLTLAINPVTTRGDVITAGIGGALQRLGIGTSGQVLGSDGTDVVWQNISGGSISGLTTNRVPYATASTSLGDSPNFTWDNTNKSLTVGNSTYPARWFTRADGSTFNGYLAGTFSSLGSADGHNTGIGWGALNSLITTTNFYESSNNTVVGYNAGVNMQKGYSNTLVGSNVGLTMVNNFGLTAVGANTLAAVAAGGFTLDAFGYNALNKNTTGYQNAAFGLAALSQNTTGNKNVAVGFNALGNNVTGYGNTAVGSEAYETGNSNANTAIGYYAGLYNHNDANVYVGFQSGNHFPAVDSTGTGSTYIGTNSGPATTTTISNHIDYAIGLGALANPSASKVAVIGPNIASDSVYRVRLGLGGEQFGNLAGTGFFMQNAITPPSTGTVSKGVLLYASAFHLYARIRGTNYQIDQQGGGGGGITNSAANNELMKSNGTNAVTSGIFSTSSGTITTAVWNAAPISGTYIASSVALAGSPTTTTQPLGTNNTTIATMAALQAELAAAALPLFSTSTAGYTNASGAATSILKGNNSWLTAGSNGTFLGISGGALAYTHVFTNAAANGEFIGSNGTDGIATGFFFSSGDLTIGTALSGADRTIQAAGSASNVGVKLLTKGTGTLLLGGTTNNIQIGSSTSTAAFNINGNNGALGGATQTGTATLTLYDGSGPSSPISGITLHSTSGKLYVYDGAGNDIPISGTTGFNRQTGNYTAVLADQYKITEMNVGSANTFTIPPHSSVALPVGARLRVVQRGSGQTTITAGAGVTFDSADSKTKTRVQNSFAEAVQVANDEWYLIGDLSL